MGKYATYIAEFGALHSFDPDAFKGTADWPQPVCDLVLALAVIFNDLHDIYLGLALHEEAKPSGEPSKTPAWAEAAGILAHLGRVRVAAFHELCSALTRSQVASPAFRRLVEPLSPRAGEAWRALEEVAWDPQGQGTSGELVRALKNIRDKVGFHYDRRMVAEGFRAALTTKWGDPPLIAAGRSFATTRFCFADAAVQAFARAEASSGKAQSFLETKEDNALRYVHEALYEIVMKFLELRGAELKPL